MLQAVSMLVAATGPDNGFHQGRISTLIRRCLFPAHFSIFSFFILSALHHRHLLR